MGYVWGSMVKLICSLATSNCTFIDRYNLHWRSIHDDITVCLQQAKDPLDDNMYLMQTDCFVFIRRLAYIHVEHCFSNSHHKCISSAQLQVDHITHL